jgi:hypothetical protein
VEALGILVLCGAIGALLKALTPFPANVAERDTGAIPLWIFLRLGTLFSAEDD